MISRRYRQRAEDTVAFDRNDAQTARDRSDASTSDYYQGSFRRGGRVKRTGIYRLHKGETVVPRRDKRRAKRK